LLDRAYPIQQHPIQRCRLADATWRDRLRFMVWVRASKIIQRTPGARGTYLHRKIGDPTTLLAIATQESKAHRDAKDDRRDETVRAILDMHAKNCDSTVIGEFDEPQWSVLPEQADSDGS
jgi:hypothetical protein